MSELKHKTMADSAITTNTMIGKASRLQEKQMPDKILTDEKDTFYYIDNEQENKISLENLNKLNDIALKK